MAGRLPTFAELVKSQGRTYAGLARLSGYSEEHVSRVGREEAPGSVPFHNAMRRLLGADYRIPKTEVKA